MRELDIGLNFTIVPSVRDTVSKTISARYNFCCMALIHPRYRSEPLKLEVPFTRSEFVLSWKEWSQSVWGKILNIYEFNTGDEEVDKLNEAALNREISWAAYLGTRNILLEVPTTGAIAAGLLKVIRDNINKLGQSQLVAVFPISDYATAMVKRHRKEDDDPVEPKICMWNRWNDIRFALKTHEKLSVALVLTKDELPSDEELDRWRGDSLTVLILDPDCFIIDENGFPSLPLRHKNFVRSLIRRVSLLLPGNVSAEMLEHYHAYFRMLWNSYKDTALSRFARGFEDHLQCPLQPLTDNLEMFTYSVFEQDTVKYLRYNEAIMHALRDKRNLNPDKVYVLIIAGAGRGVLVRSAFLAARKLHMNVKIFAVDKNPNAMVPLHSQKAALWGDVVEIVCCDMRKWESPMKADIMISELLGSFGDNELSPECLDGMQHNLKPDCVSIPQSYTSYLCPIQAPKLYQDIETGNDKCACFERGYEQLYVVHQTAVYRMDTPKKVFTFSHPRALNVDPNPLHCSLKFIAKSDAVLYGFSGYFKAVLYNDVTLSTYPNEETNGMFSWFPIYMPIKEPVMCQKGDTIKLDINRHTDSFKVWYEWFIDMPKLVWSHNKDGNSYSISLS